MDPGVGAAAPYGGGGGRRGDEQGGDASAAPYGGGGGRRGDEQGGDAADLLVPGVGGGVAVPRYSIAEVERLAEIRDWGRLGQYVLSFVPVETQQLHPELLLLCRRGQLEVFRGEDAKGYNRHQIEPLGTKATPYADDEILEAKLKRIDFCLRKGNTIDQLPNIADKINDYMRFYFGETIGYREPEAAQGNTKLWTFAFPMGQYANGQTMYRCILCQTKFRRVSLDKQHTMLHKHLTEECQSMNAYTSNLVNECTGRVGAGVGSLITSYDSPVSANEKEKLAIKGYQILHKMSMSVANSSFVAMLQECLSTITNSSNADIIKSQVLHGKELLLDVVLDTNIPKEHCVELRDWLESIKCSVKCKECIPPSESEEVAPDVFLSDVAPHCYLEDMQQAEYSPVDGSMYGQSSVSGYSQIFMETVNYEQVHDPIDDYMNVLTSNNLLNSENEQDAQY